MTPASVSRALNEVPEQGKEGGGGRERGEYHPALQPQPLARWLTVVARVTADGSRTLPQ